MSRLHSPHYQSAIILTLVLSVVPVARSEWNFFGSGLTDDFNGGGVFPGWIDGGTSPRAFPAGDSYLGPTSSNQLVLLDFRVHLGDEFDFENRLLDISFESISPGSPFPQSTPLTLTINGQAYASEVRDPSPLAVRQGVAIETDDIDFGDPSMCCSDLIIDFTNPFGGLFGLDNLVMHWFEAPGDYNGDAAVDAADYTVWRDELGTDSDLPGDVTPGSVSGSDYAVWSSNYGAISTAVPPLAAAVPEPGSIGLLMGLVAVLAIHQGFRATHDALLRREGE